MFGIRQWRRNLTDAFFDLIEFRQRASNIQLLSIPLQFDDIVDQCK